MKSQGSDAVESATAAEGGALRPSSVRKRAAVLDAARALFLRDGFTDANMDELVARSGVSKQTVYAYFGSKEALFVAMVSRETDRAADRVHLDVALPTDAADVEAHLADYGLRQLDIVLDPDLLALRRLVIAHASRFPDLAAAFWRNGPQRAIAALAAHFALMDERGLLEVRDPESAARSFNWMLMGQALNAAMLLGPSGVPDAGERRRTAAEAAQTIVAAHRPEG